MPNNSAVGCGHIMSLRFGVSVQASGACTCHVDHPVITGLSGGAGALVRLLRFVCASPGRVGFAVSVTIGLLLSNAARAGQEGAGFGVSGSVDYTFIESGLPVLTQRMHFEVEVAGCSSRIVVTPASSGVGIEPRELCYLSDGSNSCVVTTLGVVQTNSPAVHIPGVGTMDLGQGSAEMRVEALADFLPEVFPPSHAGFLFMPWLAYASSCRLDARGSGELPPMGFLGLGWPQFGGHRTSATWENSAIPPRLPSQLVEQGDKLIFDFLDEIGRKFGRSPIQPEHRGGYTNGIYQVLSWTNFSGVEIPLHFRYSRFSPPGTNQPASGLILQMTYEGHASNVVVLKDAGPFVLPKQLPKFTRVSDYRLTSAGNTPRVYMSEQGEVLTKEAVNRLERRVVADSGKGTRGVVRPVVIATAVASAGLFWVLSRGKSREARGRGGRRNGGGV